MQDEKKDEKQPIEMTTEEAIDFVFAPEIAEALRQEAGKNDDPEECDPEQTV